MGGKTMQQDYLLELDGKPAGRLFGFSGGAVEADVVTERVADGNISGKHIANTRIQDIVLKCGTGMSHAFYDWIGKSFGGAAERKGGAIVKLDQKQQEAGRLEFQDAIAKSLSLPELSKGSNADAVLTVSISPELTRSKAGGGKASLGVYVSALPSAWNVGSFRMTIPGFETVTANISKIDAMTLGLKVVDDTIGQKRLPAKLAGKIDYPNLTFYIPEAHADKLYDWFEDFVVKGNNLNSSEKMGTIEYFAPTSAKAYFTLNCKNLGIFAIKSESGMRTKTMQPVTVSLYCESMNFSAGAAAIK
jgi:hypothetical protein